MRFRVVFEHAPGGADSRIDGAHVTLEGLSGGVLKGWVAPGDIRSVADQVGPEWHGPLEEAAQRGAAGESGQIELDRSTRFPWLSIDLRSLALFRIALAVAVIVNALILLSEPFAFLSDQGIYDRSLAISDGNSLTWSLYFINGDVAFGVFLSSLTILCALAMLLGWRTRWATVMTWVLVASQVARTSFFNFGADMQLVVLLFWAMFLPLNARFSIDSALVKSPPPWSPHFSVAGVAIMLQVMYLYFFGALLKDGIEWKSTFEAVYYALSAAHLASPASSFLLAWFPVTQALTAYVWWLELLAIFFIFSPILNQQLRLIFLPQLMLLHIGFGVFLSIGHFPVVSLAGLMVFVPTLFWDKMLGWWNSRRSRSGIVLYYDKGCTFCRKVCQVLREFSLPRSTRIELAQDCAKAREILERKDSWVVRTHDGRLLDQWAAVAYVFRRSPLFWPIGWIGAAPGLRWLGDRVYRFIGNKRPALGRFSERWLPDQARMSIEPTQRVDSLVMMFALLVLLINLYSLPDYRTPFALRTLAEAVKLNQSWGVFAPRPVMTSYWPAIEGVDMAGDSHNLLLPGRPLPVGRPEHSFQVTPSHRWVRAFRRYEADEDGPRFGAYFCARGHRMGLELIEVRLRKYRQPTPRPGEPFSAHVLHSEVSVACGPKESIEKEE